MNNSSNGHYGDTAKFSKGDNIMVSTISGNKTGVVNNVSGGHVDVKHPDIEGVIGYHADYVRNVEPQLEVGALNSVPFDYVARYVFMHSDFAEAEDIPTPGPESFEFAGAGESLEDATDALKMTICDSEFAAQCNYSLDDFDANKVQFSTRPKDAIYSGMVVDIEDDIVVQKINREGDVVYHAKNKLDHWPATVKRGDVIDLKYRDGKGSVTCLDKGIEVGR